MKELIIPDLVKNNRCEIIFCVKYKRKIFKDARLAECLEMAFRAAEEKHGVVDDKVQFVVDKIEVFDSYVRLEISFDPKFGAYNAVTKLKRTAVRRMHEFDPSLHSRLPSIWTHNSYFKTIGDQSSEEDIQAYVDSQN